MGRHAREKNGKFGGKRLVEFAFKMAGQCSASVLYYLYYYSNDIVYSKIRVRTLPVLFGVQYYSLLCSYCFNINYAVTTASVMILLFLFNISSISRIVFIVLTSKFVVEIQNLIYLSRFV